MCGAIKLGTKEHMEAFYEKGEVYMQNFNYFRNNEMKDDGRGDPHEYDTYYMAGEALNNVKISVKVNDKTTGELKNEFPLDDGLINLSIQDPKKLKFSHIFCCSSIDGNEAQEKHHLLQERNFADGKDYAVLFDVNKFRDRLYSILKKNKSCLRAQSKLISYYSEEDFFGELDCFSKRSFYSYQKEIRFAALFTSPDPQTIYIGSMRDIATSPMYKNDFLDLSFRVENNRILFG